MSSLASNESNGASRSDLSEQLSRLLQPDRVVPSTNGLQCQFQWRGSGSKETSAKGKGNVVG